jgi:hypothetical protein
MQTKCWEGHVKISGSSLASWNVNITHAKW